MMEAVLTTETFIPAYHIHNIVTPKNTISPTLKPQILYCKAIASEAQSDFAGGIKLNLAEISRQCYSENVKTNNRPFTYMLQRLNTNNSVCVLN
jgi:hypothetical protein